MYLDGVDCIWIVLIVFGLCRLYLDCTIVFGLYNCMIWLYLDCVDCVAGFGTGGVIFPIPPPLLCQKVVPKRSVSIVVRLC